MSLVRFQRKIVENIHGKLPGLAQCEPYDGQFQTDDSVATGVYPPAVLLYLSGGQVSTGSGGVMFTTTDVTAYCVTSEGDGKVYSHSAAALAERVAELVEGERFGLGERVGAAQVQEVANAIRFGISRRGMAVWYVRWTQSVAFGEHHWLALEQRLSLAHEPRDAWNSPLNASA